MKNKLTFFVLGFFAFAVIVLFIHATVDSSNSYFPFIKSNAKQENLALPIQNAYAVKIPAKVSFAGEEVPLDDPEVRERLDRELTVNSYWQSSTIIMLKRANRFLPTIEKVLKEEAVPDDFKYLCMAESGLDNVVSPSGASGFWQFMRGTAPSYGLFISTEIDERYNLEKATLAACKYLLEAKNTTGSWAAAAAGYNMGIVGIQNQINKQGSSNYYDLYLNSETSRYLSRIIALKLIYENQNNYGFYIDKDDLYPVLATKEIEVNGSEDWYNFAKNNNTSYKMIRKLNPWIREPKLINKEKRTYFVSIPK